MFFFFNCALQVYHNFHDEVSCGAIFINRDFHTTQSDSCSAVLVPFMMSIIHVFRVNAPDKQPINKDRRKSCGLSVFFFNLWHKKKTISRLCRKENWRQPCKIQGAQHMIWMKKIRFLVIQEQKLGARNHWPLLEHSPTFSKISHCLKLNPTAYYNIPNLKSETNFQRILSLTALFT